MRKDVSLCRQYVQSGSGYPTCCRISTCGILVGRKVGRKGTRPRTGGEMICIRKGKVFCLLISFVFDSRCNN
jgi:hypothetical protein